MLICYGLCGSFCTLSRSLAEMEKLVNEGHEILPVGSFHFASVDTRFGRAEEFIKKAEEIAGKKMILDLAGAEPVGPVYKPDVMVIAPLTGNSLSKIANGISDTPVTLAAKAHLRNERPLVLGLASNDGLSGNFPSLAALYGRKSIYFLPLRQDDPIGKPNSLVCDFAQLGEAVKSAASGKQLRPLFL